MRAFAARSGCKARQTPIPKVGANTKFEERWSISKLGHRVRGWYWDTQLGAHWENPQDGTKGLDYQAYARLGHPVYNDHIKPYLENTGTSTANETNRIHELALADLLLYGGLDAYLEYALAWVQMTENDYRLPPGTRT